MEEPGSTQMLAHLDAENRYSYKAMQSTHRLQATLFREMYTYLRPTSEEAETEDKRETALHLAEAGGDGYMYYSRRPRGCNFPIYYRRPQRSAATASVGGGAEDDSNIPSSLSKKGEEVETILLDQNAMPDFYQRQHLGDLKVSPTSEGGREGGRSLVAFTLAAPEAMEQGTTLYIRVIDNNSITSSASSASSSSSWWTADRGVWEGIGSFEWGHLSSAYKDQIRCASTSTSTSTTHISTLPQQNDEDANQTCKLTPTRVLYYTKVNPHGRPHQLWMVRLKLNGTGLHDVPRLLYSLPDEDEAFFLSLGTTKDKKFVTCSANSKTTSDVQLLPGPGSKEGGKEGGREDDFEPVLFRKRKVGVQYFVEHGGGLFWVVTNEKEKQEEDEQKEEGGKEEDGEYRLITYPTGDTSRLAPCVFAEEEVSSMSRSSSSSSCSSGGISSRVSGISNGSSSSIEDIDLFHDHCVLYERLHGTPSLRVIARHPSSSSSCSHLPTSSSPFHRPVLPREVETGRLQPGLNQDYFADVVRFSLTSPILPEVTYEYNMKERQLIELHRETLRARPPAKKQQQQQQGYECQRHWVQSRHDEVQIPLTLAHKRDLLRPAPVLLLAYGAYGVSLDLSFRPEILPLLDRGWVIAYAHVRGGGELGRRWHAYGKGAKKINSILDYLSCVEWAIERGWTRPGLLVGQGASAGALVVAGGIHRCPEVFGGMVLKVPFLDLTRTMTDPSLALTVHEYDEWTEGRDPRMDREVEARLRELSPYDSLDLLLPSTAAGERGGGGGKALPPTLVIASLVDHRVRYWEAAKYAAKARGVREGERSGEVLLRMEGDRAHESPMAQTDVLQEAAFEAAFMITRLGLEEKDEEGHGEGRVEQGKGEGRGRGARRRAGRAARLKPRHLDKVPPLVFW
eukprot:evm.model.NODE_33510_length_18588_cov_30.463848.4